MLCQSLQMRDLLFEFAALIAHRDVPQFARLAILAPWI
jgi:hypothetical protein